LTHPQGVHPPEVHTTTTKEKQKWVVRSCFDRFLASRWVMLHWLVEPVIGRFMDAV
jgi:hypothetical protein